MATIAEPIRLPKREARRTGAGRALRTLARRRALLTAGNPRQIAVPLVGPAVLAMVVAPALQVATGGLHSHIDYTAFVDVATVGLVVPLSCIFAGLSVIVDRRAGAQAELLAAPLPRGYLVLGNLLVAIALASLQVIVLIALSAIRGASFDVSVAGLGWFAAAALLFTVFMYGLAETLASRIATPEEYVAATPAVAILPFFLAGALFPISAMPGAMTFVAKLLPLTHALALMRYGLVDHTGSGLHDIWGMHSTSAEAWLSLAVVALFATALTAISIRAFSRSAVK